MTLLFWASYWTVCASVMQPESPATTANAAAALKKLRTI